MIMREKTVRKMLLNVQTHMPLSTNTHASVYKHTCLSTNTDASVYKHTCLSTNHILVGDKSHECKKLFYICGR